MKDPESISSSSAFSEWLDRLQRDSWNLELVISGVSIFLLLNFIDKLETYLNGMWVSSGIPLTGTVILNILMGVILSGAVILTINLVMHIILRGFWIGGIGLRSVSKDIPVERLNYAEPFASRLKEKLPSLDQILQRLDRISSGIFAFAFLIVLMLFSMFIVVLVLVAGLFLISQLFKAFPGFRPVALVLSVLFFATWVFCSLLYFLDTITLGFFKRRRWIARWYYPIYVLYGRLSLAFIYRSIYYHLITNYSRGAIQLALGVFLLGFTIFPFVKYDDYIFFPDTAGNTLMWPNHYDSLRPADDHIATASIPDRLAAGDFLPLFIRYDINDNEDIRAHCGDYKPSKKGGVVSGLRFKDGVRLSDPKVSEADPESLLACLAGFYVLYIDSMRVESPVFYYYEHPQFDQKGITTMLDITALPPGPHQLRIFQRREVESEMVEEPFVEVPFWRLE